MKKKHKKSIEKKIKDDLFKGKIQIIYGPRQVGKTTLAKKIIMDSGMSYRFLRGDDSEVKTLLGVPTLENIKKALAGAQIILLDEAQSIPNIGTTLKLIYDYDFLKETQVIVTGSSSFDLKNKIAEAMTGRYYSYMLYPLSLSEIGGGNIYMNTKIKENDIMKFGLYPDIYDKEEAYKRDALKELIESTLYKDVFVMEGVKKPEVLNKLVRTLAINISQTVTIGGLAKMVGTTNSTIERYLDLLEKTFVIKRLYSFSRNLNNELKRAFKVYFIDLGFRNAVIQNFTDKDMRNDLGHVFENYFIMERIKYTEYNAIYHNTYFWQTYGDIEIDYVEEKDGTLTAYECKWQERKSKGVKLFEEEYAREKAKVHMVTRDTYIDYLHD